MTKEYLLTNGLGGYCASSIKEGNTRKYHGLLVVPDKNLDRFVLVSKIEESLIVDEDVFDLSTNQYAPDTIYPEGHKYIENFSHTPCPTWEFEIGDDIKIEKRLHMVAGENATILEYKISTKKSFKLQLFPLVTCRNVYALTPQTDLSEKILPKGDGFQVQTADKSFAYMLRSSKGKYRAYSQWFHNFHYPYDHLNTGDMGTEDLWNPGYFSIEIPKGETTFKVHCCAATNKTTCQKVEKNIDKAKLPTKKAARTLREKLEQAGNDFIVQHEGHTKVIAGYPWFKDWGRDSMISFKGLFILPGRFKEAKDLLLNFSTRIKDGLVPNRVTGLEDYHTIDASLWYVVACSQYIEASKDKAFAEYIFPSVKDILQAYEQGTTFGIQMDPADNCILWTDKKAHLTWMDALIDNKPVTERSGKAVEIQALWYNALLFGAQIAKSNKKSKEEKHWSSIAEKLKTNFLDVFWNPKTNCLLDVVKKKSDPAIRPNQLYTISLPHALVEGAKAKKIVETVEKHLVTPVGLRTLSPEDKLYQGEYRGDQKKRDLGYHNGTIWPFLLGPYFQAYLKAHKNSNAAIKKTREYYQQFTETLEHQCAGQISEIYEADTLEARGCFAQAWSIACNLEVLDQIGEK